MTIKDINQAVESLIKTNQTFDSAEDVITVPVLTAIDLASIIDPYLTPEAKVILSNKTYNLLYQYNVKMSNNKYFDKSWVLADFFRKLEFKHAEDFDRANYIRMVAQVDYFGFTVEETKVGEAAIKLTQVINNLASKKMILATLAPMSAVRLADGRYCVVSYLAVDSQYQSLVKSTYANCMFLEGGMPPELI